MFSNQSIQFLNEERKHRVPTSQWAGHEGLRWSSDRGMWGTCGKHRRRASERAGRYTCWCRLSAGCRLQCCWCQRPYSWRERVCEGRGSGDPAGRAADRSGTPVGRAHRTEWQHRKPGRGEIKTQETRNSLNTYIPLWCDNATVRHFSWFRFAFEKDAKKDFCK